VPTDRVSRVRLSEVSEDLLLRESENRLCQQYCRWLVLGLVAQPRLPSPYSTRNHVSQIACSLISALVSLLESCPLNLKQALLPFTSYLASSSNIANACRARTGACSLPSHHSASCVNRRPLCCETQYISSSSNHP
jgi:hypothetical protein